MVTKIITATNFIKKEFQLVDEEEWGTFQEWEAKGKLKLGGIDCSYAIISSGKYSFFGENGVIVTIPNTQEAGMFQLSYTTED